MSTVRTTYDDSALGGKAIARDQARELLGQVMGYVAITVGFAALGAYLGRDLSGMTGLVLFIGAFACIFGLNVAAAKGREQLAIGLLFGMGLLIGFGIVAIFVSIPNGNVIYAVAGLGIFGAFTIFDFNRLRRADAGSAVGIAASIFLDVFNIFLLLLSLFGGRRD